MDMSQNLEDNNDTNNNATGRGSDDAKDLICRDYQRGVCTRGSKCKFKHPDGMGTELTNSPMICRDYQNGKCQRPTCKYLHLSNNEEKIYLRTGQMPPRRDPFSVPFRGEQTRAGPNDPVCKDYLNRKCTRGQGCRYRHVMEEEDQSYGGYGFDGPSGKRRRESYEGQSYYHIMDENESLRRRVADLQKQVADLKATNEVLLEQNAKYRNQIGERGSYNGSGSGNSSGSGGSSGYSSSYGTSSSQSYSTSYPPRESYATKDPYSSYSSPPGGSSYVSSGNYTSNSAYGTGYTKFD